MPSRSLMTAGRSAAWSETARGQSALAERGFELFGGDVLDARSLRGAGEGIEVAYYLVHAMGRGGEGDFEEMERRAARNFAEMAGREKVARVIYLGGLGDRPRSKHLRSRQPPRYCANPVRR